MKMFLAIMCINEPTTSDPNAGDFYGTGNIPGSMRFIACVTGYIWSDGMHEQKVPCLSTGAWSSIPSELTCQRMISIIFSNSVLNPTYIKTLKHFNSTFYTSLIEQTIVLLSPN